MDHLLPRDELKITQFINPHLFWVQKCDTEFDPKFLEFKHKLNEHYKRLSKTQPWTTYKPKIGDTVACFDKKMKVWFRAQIDHRMQVTNARDNDLIVWMIDHGQTIEAKSEDVRRLDSEFRDTQFDHIFKVGIMSIMPAEEELDFHTHRKTIVRCDDWAKRTVDKLKEFLDDVPEIYFHTQAFDEDNGHAFGDLVVRTHAGKDMSVRQNLLNLNAAISVPEADFMNEIRRVELFKMPRFRDNSGHRLGRDSGSKIMFNTTKAPPHVEPDSGSDVTQNVMDKVETWFYKNKHLSAAPIDEVEEVAYEDVGPAVDEVPPLVNDNSDNDSVELMSANLHNRTDLSESGSSVSEVRPPKSSHRPQNIVEPPPMGTQKGSRILEHLAARLRAKQTGQLAPPPEQPKIFNFVPHDYQQVIDQERCQKINTPKVTSNYQAPPPPIKPGNTSKLMQIVSRTKRAPSVASSKSHRSKDDDEEEQMRKENLLATYEKLIDRNLEETLTFQERSTARLMDDDGVFRFNVENPLVLAHGKRLQPVITSHKEANFTLSVMNYMRRYRDMRRIQSHAWPHIMDEKSAVIVGAAQTGKTLSYVPVVCSLIERLLDDEEISEKGPLAIIMLPSAGEVNKVFRMCRDCFSAVAQKPSKKINFTVQAYGHYKHQEVESQLLEGAGILIVTPPCLNRLTENEPKLFTKAKTRILVVDDYDLCLKRFGPLMEELIDRFYERNTAGDPTQVVIVSNFWDKSLLKYTRYGKSPALFISHYAEAALYAGTKFKISYKPKNEKLAFIFKEHLENEKYKKVRTAIICTTDDEVCEVSRELQALYQVMVTPYTCEASESERRAAFRWHKTENNLTVLITSDSILTDLFDTKNVQYLINYSLPESWFRLTMRFTMFFNYYHNYVVNGVEPEGYQRPESLILISETDKADCFLRFVEFMKRTEAKIPAHCNDIANTIKMDREDRCKSVRLCTYFLQFSECNSPDCRDRHTLQPYDRPTDRMPKEGTLLKVKLTHVHHPTHYSARLLEYHAPGERNWHKFDQAFMEVGLKLQMYYKSDENLESVAEVQKGEIYTWVDEPDRYHRCKVVDVIKSKRANRDSDNVRVVLRLIDSGRIIYNQSVSTLLILPEDLKAYAPQAVDIHLTGLVPYDGDTNWDRDTVDMINRIMIKHDSKVRSSDEPEKEFFVQLTSHYVLEDNIWTTKISTVEYFKHMQKKQEVFPLHKMLLRNDVAMRDPEERALNKIKELAKICGFFDNHKDKEKTKSIQVEKPELPVLKQARGTFDYLEQNTLIPIKFDHFDEYGTFFCVRRDKFPKLNELYKKIDAFVDDPKNCVALESLESGKNILGLFDGAYSRCRLVRQLNEEPPIYEVYLCDCGDIDRLETTKMIETTDDLTKWVCFCAIRGRLVGTLPKDGDIFSEDEMCTIEDQLKMYEGNVFARVIKMNPNTDDWNIQSGLNYYDLLLVAFDGAETIILNSKFIEDGIVKADPAFDLSVISPEALRREFPVEDVENSSSENDDWEHLVGTREIPKPVPKSDVELPKEFSSFEQLDLEDDELEAALQIFGFGHIADMIKEQKKTNVDDKVEKVPEKRETEEIIQPKVKQEVPQQQSKPRPPLNLLRQDVRTVPVVWQQNDELILLSIKVGDVEDYFLEITAKDLIFEMVDLVDNVPCAVVLTFFGVVDINRVSYEKRGLNVIVRLPKVAWHEWPRLLESEDKLPYIKYNLETLNVIDQYFIPRIKKGNEYRESSYESDNDSIDIIMSDDDLENPLYDGFIK